jgi:hypothetical protein
MLGLAGVTTMPLSPKGPAHPVQVIRDTVKDPTNNIAKTNLIFFMRIPPRKEAAKLGLRDANF